MQSDGDAFRGVTIQRGTRLRLTDLSITLGGEASIRFQVQWDMFPTWLSIADTARDAAVTARNSNPGPDGEEAYGVALDSELTHAMTSLCASAFALEAFSNSVRVHLPPSSTPLPSAAANRVRHVINTGFVIPNDTARGLREPFSMLFRLRNDAVHPPAGFVDPIRHPAFPIDIEPSYVKYRSENAVNASKLARDIITYSLSRPRSKYPELVAWSEGALNNLRE